MIAKGIRFRLATSKGETLAIFELAINTPEIGESVLPMEAENSIGNIIEVVLMPNLAVIFGTNGPKAKKAAFPLPINTEASSIIIAITMLIPIPPNPRL